MICKETLFSDHSISQMFKRNISVDDVKSIIENGDVIIAYLKDKPFPSFLLLGFIAKRPLHIVVAKSELERCIIVTAYEPDKNIWKADFKSKKG